MLWTVWCVLWLPLVALVDSLVAWPVLLLWGLVSREPLDSLGRCFNQHFGRTLVRASWPLVRVERRGWENMPATPCVVVLNHRSFIDIFMGAFLPPSRRFVVFVRAWPFRIWVLGRFMRLAGYKDIESGSIESVIEGSGRRHLAMGDCFLFFPEGHRSKTGRLQRFRLGAFSLAVRYHLPVVPVCVSGTEKLMADRPWVSPARVTMTMLPAIDSTAFGGEHPDVELKEAVQRVCRDYFGESK